MTGHRQVMGRAPADLVSQGRVAAYLGVTADAPLMARPDGAGVDAGLDTEWGRWLALGPIFALTLLGLGRWWLRHGGRA
jgi:hypothetical protein